ncbi:MAG TPA: hypothetical protein PKY77_12530 [Phycisphaerae bacterium]|nr:hypothetical protein [Phycisphaerae bacterium]HRY69154.1 hypothetical protein [Phycisphaerae bacterium]HSA26115.1 hypothetical protein [Phycisphaerae bacterium]
MSASQGVPPRRRWAVWSKRLGIAAALLLVVVAGTGWLLFQHIPAWYRPMEISPEAAVTVRTEFANMIDGVGGGLNSAQGRFECRFTQAQLNTWVAGREAIDPMTRKWLPSGLRDPMVVIEPDGARLAVAARTGGVETVLGLKVQAHVEEKGIRVWLTDVTCGSLPVPRALIEDQLGKIDAALRSRGGRGEVEWPIPSLTGLFEGILLPNEWDWPNVRRRFRIAEVRAEPGILILTLEPLGSHRSR